MIYVIQILSILFAVALARHDAPAVTHFRHYGADNNEMAKFHRNNNYVKFIYCLLASAAVFPDWKEMLFSFIVSGLWIYFLFDIVLNKNRPGFSWDYVGLNDADGRRWTKWFGDRAGEAKASILLVLIIIINVLIFVL